MSGEINLLEAQRDRVEGAPERVIAEAIHNIRRRYALYYLHKQNGPVELMELVRQVAAWERCCQPEDVTSAHRKSVYSALQQIHLPYLEERGLVAFDRKTNEIESLLKNSELDLSLAADPRTKVQWYRVYLLAAGFSVFLLGGAWAGVQPFARISPMVLAVIFVGTYAVASGVHWYDVHCWRRRMTGMPPDFVISKNHGTVGGTGSDGSGPERGRRSR